MPSKKKRAASRQARLSQRRGRRGGRGRPNIVEQGTPESSVDSSNQAENSASATAVASSTGGTSAVRRPSSGRVATAAAPARQRRRSTRLRNQATEPLQTYAYLGSELRRIGALTAFVAVILAILTVVLR